MIDMLGNKIEIGDTIVAPHGPATLKLNTVVGFNETEVSVRTSAGIRFCAEDVVVCKVPTDTKPKLKVWVVFDPTGDLLPKPVLFRSKPAAEKFMDGEEFDGDMPELFIESIEVQE